MVKCIIIKDNKNALLIYLCIQEKLKSICYVTLSIGFSPSEG